MLLTRKPPVRVTGTTVSVKSVSPEANLRFDGATGRQGLQMPSLCQNGVGPLPVAPCHQEIHEAPVICEGCEVAVAAQDQRLCNGGLEMPVLRFHRAILVGLTPVVAARLHAVVPDKGLIAQGNILALVSGQVAERGGQAVGAVVVRRTSQRPKGLLQVLGQNREALPAQNHTDMFPPAVDHDEVIKQMRKRLPRDHHVQVVGMGEVGPIFLRRGHIAGLRRLTEDDAPLWPVQRPPLPYTPLKGSSDAVIGKSQRMQALQMAQQGDGLKGAVLGQQREQVGFPIAFKRVRDGAAMRDLAVGWQRRIGVNAAGGAFAEPGTGGRGSLTMGLEV